MSSSGYSRWHGEGRIGPADFFGWGFALAAVKYILDALMASVFFHRTWLPTAYFSMREMSSLLDVEANELRLMLILILFFSLPFAWAGVMLCVQRLRDAGYPTWIAALFFVPPLNLLLFVVLCLLPSREPGEVPMDAGTPEARRFGKLITSTRLGAAALAVPATAVFALVVTAVGATAMADYEGTLFIALPFCQGLIATLIYNYHAPRTLRGSIAVAELSMLVVGAILLVVAIEGVICLIMAAPIWSICVAVGACFGHVLMLTPVRGQDAVPVIWAVLISMPAMLACDAVGDAPAPVRSVTTRVIVDAPAERVWEYVTAFPPLPEPTDWFFRAGVAYPVRARIEGRWAGGIRYCEFSTGAFVEPITTWDRPRLLAFDVTENPQPMRELSPYDEIHPPHLSGFMVSHRGEFRLTALPDGRTQVDGTTWYSNAMWPQTYWRGWSDAIVHRIHRRVLDHIKRLAEGREAVASN